MGLTGLPFVGSLVLLALAAMAACVWRLPRIRGAPARLALILGTELALTTAALAAANAAFAFFASWPDLLGEGGGGVNVVAGEPARDAAPVWSVRRVHDPIARAVPAKEGRLEPIVVRGPRSGLFAPSYVYLPPQYAQRAYRHTRFPVVLILTSDPRGLVTRLRLPSVAAAAVARHALQPTVYVMAGPVGCVDVPGGRQYGTFLSQDVPAALAGAYRIARGDRGWGVLGDASGGYCAATLVMEHSDRFTAGASAATTFAAPPGDLYGRSAAIRDENDLVWRLRHRPPPPADLVAIDDGAGAARPFAALMRPPMRGGVIALTGGGGALPTWGRDVPGILGWFDRRIGPER